MIDSRGCGVQRRSFCRLAAWGAGLALTGAAGADDLVVTGFNSGKVLRFDGQGTFLRELALGGRLLFPGGVVYAPDGHLLVGDEGRGEVQKYDKDTGQLISVLIDPGVGGLDTAACMLIGGDERLYVCNSAFVGNVLRFNSGTGQLIDTFASSPTFSRGSDMVFRGNSLYACSEGSSEVLRFDAGTGAFQGVFCSTGLFFPRGLGFGPDGHLYVASAFGNDVRKFHGQTGADLGVFIASGAGLASPADIDFGPDGDLYVCDSANNRVARFDGASGAYIGDFATGNGLDGPRQMIFVGEGCYADCDRSTGPGVLDIFDFLCFQNRYSTQDPYACDCDRQTGPAMCDIFDFLCFQNAYAAGCP